MPGRRNFGTSRPAAKKFAENFKKDLLFCGEYDNIIKPIAAQPIWTVSSAGRASA
jgi:predicted peptidase